MNKNTRIFQSDLIVARRSQDFSGRASLGIASIYVWSDCVAEHEEFLALSYIFRRLSDCVDPAFA